MRLFFYALIAAALLAVPAAAGDKTAAMMMRLPAHKPATTDLRPGEQATGDGLAASMAPSLLKTKTQIRILKHDDEQAGYCRDKRFADAQIVTRPSDAGRGQRKWQEQWVLDRCGIEVGYRVFFTDVGDGGAYFAFQQTN